MLWGCRCADDLEGSGEVIAAEAAANVDSESVYFANTDLFLFCFYKIISCRHNISAIDLGLTSKAPRISRFTVAHSVVRCCCSPSTSQN